MDVAYSSEFSSQRLFFLNIISRREIENRRGGIRFERGEIETGGKVTPRGGDGAKALVVHTTTHTE